MEYSKHSAMVTYPEPDKSNPPMQNYCFKILDLLKHYTPLCTLAITTLHPPFPSVSEHLVPVFIPIIRI
jgi:hypothetical protein